MESSNELPRLGLERRRLLAAGFSAPVIVVVAAAPAIAASGVVVTIGSTGASGSGYNLHIHDGKVLAAAVAGTFATTGTKMVLLMFQVTEHGAALAGASISVTPDNSVESEGNHLIGFVDKATTSNQGESSTLRATSGTTDTLGQFTVAVATASLGAADGSLKPGTFTVVVNGQPTVFTYAVFV
jgi:hypothetical protein